MALRLGLIAQQQGLGVGFADAAPKSFAQQEVAVLRVRDFDVADEVRVHRDHGSIYAKRGLGVSSLSRRDVLQALFVGGKLLMCFSDCTRPHSQTAPHPSI